MKSIIYNITVMFCDKLSNFGIIPAERKKVYIYGYELLLSSVVGIFCLMILSGLIGKPFIWIPYLMGFVSLRITGGGYHAKSHWGCIVSFSIVFLILYAVGNSIYQATYVNVIFALFALGMAYFLAPVEAVNKPLKPENRRKNRRRCLAISLFNAVFSWIILIAGIDGGFYVAMYFTGIFAAAISMIAALPGNRIKNGDRSVKK